MKIKKKRSSPSIDLTFLSSFNDCWGKFNPMLLYRPPLPPFYQKSRAKIAPRHSLPVPLVGIIRKAVSVKALLPERRSGKILYFDFAFKKLFAPQFIIKSSNRYSKLKARGKILIRIPKNWCSLKKRSSL